MPSFDFKLWSHPNKLLADHLGNVLENCRRLYADLPLEDEYRRALELALILHDLGKASIYFQQYIHAIAAFEEGVLSLAELGRVKHRLGFRKNHARLSAMWGLLLARHLFGEDSRLPLFVFLAVLKHHGNFTDFDQMTSFPKERAEDLRAMSADLDYPEMAAILAQNGFAAADFNHATFVAALDTWFNNYRWTLWSKRTARLLGQTQADALPALSTSTNSKPDSGDFFQLSLMFSILLACDKGECIFDGMIRTRAAPLPPATMVAIHKTKKAQGQSAPQSAGTAALNRMREAVFQEVASRLALNPPPRHHFYSINVPCGIGKTFAALNAALQLLHGGHGLNKILYCLPFTSVIDQNGRVIEHILEDAGVPVNSENLLIYHHLSELHYKARDDDDEIEDYRAEYLITQFESHINVTTFYQFLHGVFTGRNREIRKLASFANTVVILDEVQSIPAKYWPLVRDTLRQMAARLNIVFILVTATMPLIFSEEKGEILELVESKRAVFAAMNRIALNTSYLARPQTLAEFAAILLEAIAQRPRASILIVVNTKACARELFELLAEAGLDKRLVFLSTDVIPRHRLERIGRIGDPKKPKPIVISTQLVEAGVDIDLDIVYRDLAPLDSVFQAAGRCNRHQIGPPGNAGNAGKVYLVDLRNHNDRAFASQIYGAVELNATRELLATQTEFPESRFFDLAQAYYHRMAQAKDLSPSTRIWGHLCRLDYQAAFGDAPDAFRLIDQLDRVPGFVAILPQAKKLLAKYTTLCAAQFDRSYDRKRAMRELMRCMAPYMVSVPQRFAPQTENGFFIIDEDSGEFEYHKATGLRLKSHLLF